MPEDSDTFRDYVESAIEATWDARKWEESGPTYIVYDVMKGVPAIAGFRMIPDEFWDSENEWHRIAKRLLSTDDYVGTVWAPRAEHETLKIITYIRALRAYKTALPMHLAASLGWQLSIWFWGVLFSDDPDLERKRMHLAALRHKQLGMGKSSDESK